MGGFFLVVDSAFSSTALLRVFLAHRQVVRGVGVGYEEPHLRLMA